MIENSLKNHQKNHAKWNQNPSKNHPKIDAEKHVKIEICPGPNPVQPGIDFISPGKHIKVNKTHTDILQKAS